MCQAVVAENENLESRLVDSERETISHCASVQLLEIHLNHSLNEFAFAFRTSVKRTLVLSHDFFSIFCSIFCAENLSTRHSCALFISHISFMFLTRISRKTITFIGKSL